MGLLEAARPAVIICTRDRARAVPFYHDVLGLKMISEDHLAAVFDVAGIALRISTVADFKAHEHTILGFSVPDVAAVVKALSEKGVTFNIYKNFNQDELGILTVPGSKARVAWLKDPDGNVLSITDV